MLEEDKSTKSLADKQLLEDDILQQSNLLKTDRLDLSFGELMSMYEREEIIIKPAFQRCFRWTIEQRTRFMESLLLGIPIPPIFVATDSQGVWELVDGLQRVSSVLSFFGLLRSTDEGIKENNNWILTEGDRIPRLDGFTYETLPNKFRLNIRRAICRVEILKWNSNYDMRFELFNRLNTGGTPLTPQEIRNCIYRDISSKFNDFLQELAINEDFRTTINLPAEQYERLYDEELALRFLSLYKNRANVKTSIAQHMTNFMREALTDDNFDYKEAREAFEKVFSLLAPAGSSIFRQSNGAFATALFDVITIGIGENYELYANVSTDEIKKKIDLEVRTDATLIKFSRKGGNNQRQRILNRLREGSRIFGTI